MKRKATIQDVADYAQVSKSSVSRYLNQGYVSQENRLKIAKAIEVLGFQRDFFASRLKAKKSRLIGILLQQLHQPMIASMLAGIQKKLVKEGYQFMLMLYEDEAMLKQNIESLHQFGVDGYIFLDQKDPEAIQEAIEKTGKKAVFANEICFYAPFLRRDEVHAGKVLGNYLLDKEIERILFYMTHEDIGKQRIQGMQAAYDAAQKSCDIQVLQTQQAYEDAYQLLEKKAQIIVCESAQMALSVWKYFQEFHIHVPQNISLLAFGDSDACRLSSPSLSVISYDDEAFGANLSELCLSLIEGRIPCWENVAITCIERESVAP